MNSSCPPYRIAAPLSLAIGLAFAAPAAFAQSAGQAKAAPAPAAAVKPAATPAVTAAAKPATSPAAPSSAAAKPATAAPAASAGTTPATPAAPGAAPADPNAAPPAPPPPPLCDIIFTNGDVVTLDDKKPSAQAVAIKGTKIVAVGRTKDVLARWNSEGTEVVDLGGKTLLPGFIDAWGQMSRLGLYSVAAQLQAPPLGRVGDTAGLQRELREWAKGDLAQRFGWIIGFGYDESRLKEQRAPSRNDLDAVHRDKPVIIIHHSGRQLVANSKALEIAGISRDSLDPPGGHISRWPGSKEPDGLLEGAAASALIGALPQLGKDDRQAMIQQGQSLYLKNGYTTAVEGRATPEDLALYTQAADLGALKLDVAVYGDLASSAELLKGSKTLGAKYYKSHLRIAGVSFMLDGSADERSAWLGEPYLYPPAGKRSGFAGYQVVGDDVLAALLGRAYANGWQVAVEANGDAAIGQFLGALRAAAAQYPGKDRRPLLVGAQMIRDEQLDALKEAGGSLSLAPQRLALGLSVLEDETLGVERAARFIPAGSAQRRGLPVLLHTDQALLEPAALPLIAAAVQRPIGADQQLAPLDALKALTVLAARQIGEEKIKGSISTGKLADLVVLSANPLKTPADKLGEIRVIGTVKEGATVYSSNEGGVPITH